MIEPNKNPSSGEIKINATGAVQPVTPDVPVETPTTIATTTPEVGTTIIPEPIAAPQASVFGSAFTFALNHATLALLLLLLLGAILFVLERYWRGYPSLFAHKRSRKGVAHAQLHEQFEELRDALTEEMFALQHAKTKRELTDEEERFLSRFDRLLNKVESTIERDLLK